MTLTGKQRRFLRAEAHALNPLVAIGKEGLSESVLGAVKEALLAHELIKVRVLDTAPLARQELAEQLPALVKAELAGLIGRVVVLYKRHPHKPRLELPRDR
jgi:RNA-binding protein